MFRDRLRSLLGDATALDVPAATLSMPSAAIATRTLESRARNSHGLEQFFTAIKDQENLNILDLAGASQANISFITNLGHRLYSADFLMALDQMFGEDYAMQGEPERVRPFLAQNLNFPEGHFDGALMWDALQYVAPPLLATLVDRLAYILKPKSYVLSFFQADEKAAALPLYSYRITNEKTLLLVPRGYRKPAQFFNNRGLEKLFHQFDSVKFFLTRDHLREVIVKR